jgi:predicted HTH domain antitoxin
MLYTNDGVVDMSDTVIVSMRLPKSEVGRFVAAAAELGIDRATFLRMAIRMGAQDVLLEHACAAYRRGEITLSRAAEIAGISLHELLAKMDKYDLQLNYGIEELEKDLRT